MQRKLVLNWVVLVSPKMSASSLVRQKRKCLFSFTLFLKALPTEKFHRQGNVQGDVFPCQKLTPQSALISPSLL